MINTPFVFHFQLSNSDEWKSENFKDGYIEGNYINTLIGQSVPLDDFIYGEWLNIRISKSFLEIKTDLVGFYRLFYYMYDDELILSNDFDSLVIYLKQHNVKLTPNEVVCNLTFNVKDSYFYNLFSADTFCEQIKTLEPGQKIVFDGKSISIKSNNVYELASKHIGKSSYDELLNLGINQTKKLVKQIRKEGKEINVFLSGGYDSRVCLALLLSVLKPEDIFVTTVRPHKRLSPAVRSVIEQDYVIACTICHKLGIPFFNKKNEIGFMLGYSANFSFLKNFINNNYFSVSISSQKKLDNFNSVEIRGGAGELLRGSSYLDRLSGKLTGTNTSVVNDLEVLFQSLDKDSEFIGKDEKKYFFDINNRYPGENIFEKFDYRFLNSRNNRHFGHHRKSFSEGKYTFMPLVNPYFLVASRQLTYAERKSGKLALDIIKMTYKDLIDIPFADQLNEENKSLLFDLESAKAFHGESESSALSSIISVSNRDSINSESLYHNLQYMVKRAEFLSRENESLKLMFKNVKKTIEEKNKFDHLLHNKLLSFLSIYEPNYSSFMIFRK